MIGKGREYGGLCHRETGATCVSLMSLRDLYRNSSYLTLLVLNKLVHD